MSTIGYARFIFLIGTLIVGLGVPPSAEAQSDLTCEATQLDGYEISLQIAGHTLAGITTSREPIKFTEDDDSGLKLDKWDLSTLKLDYSNGAWREALFPNGQTTFQRLERPVVRGIWAIRNNQICFNYDVDDGTFSCKTVLRLEKCGLLDGHYLATVDNEASLILTSKIIGVHAP